MAGRQPGGAAMKALLHGIAEGNGRTLRNLLGLLIFIGGGYLLGRHALLLAAGEFAGILPFDLLRQADLGQVVARAGHGVVAVHSQDVDRALDHVLQHRQVAPQVEMLEDHRQPAADLLQLPGIGGAQLAQGAGTGAQFLVADADAPGTGLFQEVDAAQEGALARAGGADDADHVSLAGPERNAPEHLMAAVALVDVFDLQAVHARVSGRGQWVCGLR